MAKTYNIIWPGNLHDLVGWARLLIQHRMTSGLGYADLQFALRLIEHSQRVYERWRETLRYKKNRAYPAEVNVVGQSTAWILDHAIDL
jgi:hypothetical protein